MMVSAASIHLLLPRAAGRDSNPHPLRFRLPGWPQGSNELLHVG